MTWQIVIFFLFSICVASIPLLLTSWISGVSAIKHFSWTHRRMDAIAGSTPARTQGLHAFARGLAGAVAPALTFAHVLARALSHALSLSHALAHALAHTLACARTRALTGYVHPAITRLRKREREHVFPYKTPPPFPIQPRPT